MPTTSNFGWTTPADTDLVKDGALAIRTLGNGIDTSMAELKGGTTGQILSKTSNTDMDFTWINNDQGDITAVNVTSPITGGGTSGAVTISIQDGTTAQKGAVQLENSTSSTSTTTAAVPASVKSAYDLANAAIPKSLVDAAGDLIYATANDTVARLALGTANQVLTVNSGATAPEWKTPASGGGLVFITRNNFSAVSSVSLNNVFSSTYDSYRIILDLYGQETNGYIRLRANGTDNSSSNYYWSSIYGSSAVTTVSADRSNGLNTQWTVMDISSFNGGSRMTYDITDPFNTARTNFSGNGTYIPGADNQNYNIVRAGSTSVTTSYDGFTFYPAAGTVSGDITVFGYARS